MRRCPVLLSPTIYLPHPTVSSSFPLLANQPLFYRHHFFPNRQMADHEGSAHFQALFESALQGYVKETGITLTEHPLAVQLQSCNSVESIDNLVHGQARAFSNFRESDKITKAMKTAVSKSNTLSATAFLGDAFGLVRQNALMGLPHPNRLSRKSHLRMHYLLRLLSSLMYVPLSSSYIDTCDIQVTRRPRA